MRYAVRTAFVALTLMILFTGANVAFAIDLPAQGVRFAASDGELCLTRSNMPPEALKLLNVSAETALAAMESDDSYLMVLSPDGLQVNLRVLPAPEGLEADDVSQLDAAARTALLRSLARLHSADSAEWSGELADYAVLKTSGKGAMAMNTLALDTLYFGHIYSFQLDVVGRSVGEPELALLHSIVSRTLRLGAPSPESQPLMLAELPTLSTENAIVTTDNSDIQISLDPIPSVIGTNQLVITGATDPAAKLRLKFDGNTSSAISPAEDGSFSITAKNLNNGQPNELGIAVRLDKLTTELAFTVMVDWQQLPLVLSTLSATSYQDQFTVEGLTLPGAEVQVVKGGTTSSLTVDENGRFSILLTTKKDGNYKFTVRASMPGYRRAEQEGKIRRQTADAAIKAAASIAYADLAKDPAPFADTTVLYAGTVIQLGYEHGQAMYLLELQEGARLLCLCASTAELTPGQSVRVIGTLTGQAETFGEQAYPVLTVSSLLP
ncbi:MAG: carboxypeptidase-like regulatory domain-containing protein [Clostridia bacterium]